MADKFPALDSVDDNIQEGGGDSDFLSREKELVGDEFQTEHDQDMLGGSDDEINDFKEQFPEVDKDNEEQQESEEQFEGFESNDSPTTKFEGESKHLNEWKQRRDLEIEEREKANEKKKQDIIGKAQQTIDDFYDNYNNKQEQQSKQVLKEEEEFLAKRDGFLKRGTLWDRVDEIVQDIGETSNDDRDKSRFTGLLKKLKGKENVPGAGGY